MTSDEEGEVIGEGENVLVDVNEHVDMYMAFATTDGRYSRELVSHKQF